MRARFIYEKFSKNSDPIKDLKIGIKDYRDYVRYVLEPFNLDVNEFQTFLYGYHGKEYINQKRRVIDDLLFVLENTPLSFQITYMSNVLYFFLIKKGIDEDVALKALDLDKNN